MRQCFYSVPVRYAGHAHRRAPGGRDRRGPRRGTRWSPATPGRSARASRPSTSTTTSRPSRSSPGPSSGSTALHQARATGSLQPHPRPLLRERPAPTRRTRRDQGPHRGAARPSHLAYEAVVAGIDGALAVGSLDPDVVVVEARRATERPGDESQRGPWLWPLRPAAPDRSTTTTTSWREADGPR